MWNATGPDSNRNPPPGIVPNFHHPEDVYWTLNVVMASLCIGFVTTFFVIRIIVKHNIKRKFLNDDWTCAIAYLLIILYITTILIMARYGAGYHAWEIRKPRYYNWLTWFYASTIVYCPAAFFIKATILLLMARVFAVERRVSKGIKVFLWALLVAYLPIEILRVCTCLPIKSSWDPNVRKARCLNQRKVFFSSLALSMGTDIMILLLPMPLKWRLRVPIRKKVKIFLLLSAGGVATALTIYRTYEVAMFLESDDITVDYVPIGILTVVELTIGFVCACLPSLNLLIEHGIRKRRRECQNPNWPRDLNSRQYTKRRFRWISSSTDSSAPPISHPYPAHLAPDRFIDLDIELAIHTGQPVRVRPGRCDSAGSLGCRPLGHRLNSVDGRREGWLSSK